MSPSEADGYCLRGHGQVQEENDALQQGTEKMRSELLTDAAELDSLRKTGDIVIVDCRFDLRDPAAGAKQYAAAHIPSAVFADLDSDLSAPVTNLTGRHPLADVDELSSTFGRLGIDRRTPVVVYDADSGALAARCWWLLRWLGHERVRLLDGGLAAWQAAGLPVDAGTVTAEPRHFDARPRPGLLFELQELLDNGASAEGLYLIDARDAARFRGDIEPIDPVAGHIPGAINLPYTAALHEDGTWRSDQEIRAIWADVLGGDRDTATAAMCGSGVTACHLIVSALLAGNSEPRVYIGSWSEWIRDPQRPVATGGE